MNNRTVIISIGVPGSGKSSAAKAYIQANPTIKICICSADNYFINKNGEYIFDKSKLKYAHKFCQNKFTEACQDKTCQIIIVDNTNLKRSDRKFYIDMATKYNIAIKYFLPEDFIKAITCPKEEQEKWIKLFSERNIHKVPIETIRRMLSQWESNDEIEKNLKNK